ncbi:MAG: hypothetical protein RL392_1638 [Pseudomonadota bacterium]|jgi:hypothetical protein
MPSASAPLSSSALTALYRSTLQEAAAGGEVVMGKLVASARQALSAREAASRDFRERDVLIDSAKQLRNWESELCKRFPKVLLDAFSRPVAADKAALKPVAEVNFDQLELMDESHVHTSVVHARMQQVVVMTVEASLSELNTLVCATLGLTAVQAERNPLRPEIYIKALTETVGQTTATTAQQLDWLAAMGVQLSLELDSLYATLNANLRAQGVVAAAFVVTQPASGRLGIGRGIAQSESPLAAIQPAEVASPQHLANAAVSLPSMAAQPVPLVRHKDEALLTLDRLRKLLSGELDSLVPADRMEQFSQQFARQFESGADVAAEEPNSEFDSTVPAALEALTEMKQVDRVVGALRQRQGLAKSTEAIGVDRVNAQRYEIRRHAKNVAQALSVEVVTLMVENMARDPRLLAPVQGVIRSLEPALLRLSLADPRFFTDKHHPARQLLQEITHRSLAFQSVASSGFDDFLQEVVSSVSMLETVTIADYEPFERVLLGLQDSWGRASHAKERAREAAVVALQNAEARNLLAEKIARAVDSHPDANRVSPVVIDFLCGPWAQVVAQARLSGVDGVKVADQYQALISALLWSVHPELAAKNVSKLTRLLPRLLSTLREGLDSIHYPTARTSAFFEKLMLIHQQAFKTSTAPSVPKKARSDTPVMVVGGERARFVENGDPWVAPEEALSSNFVEIEAAPNVGAPVSLLPSDAVEVMPVGTWIELKTADKWSRTQLTWASPHGTLFLFTNSFGATQSMTRRTRDKLVENGSLRMLLDIPVVDVALNAVAQIAMRNSMDTTL